MPIYINGKEIDNIFYQGKEISQVMWNGKEIWSNGKAIYLGQGQEFDVSAVYSKWKDLTVDNFAIVYFEGMSHSATAIPDGYVTLSSEIIKKYDTETGKLTCYSRVGEYKIDCKVVLMVRTDKLISLGSKKTYDLTNQPNYKNFTVNNFVGVNVEKNMYNYNGYRHLGGSGSERVECIKTYDPEKGELTFYYKAAGSASPDSWNLEIPFTNVYLLKKAVE